MLLNNNDLRIIELALGMVLGISDFGNPGASTLVEAVEMIDFALTSAEKRELLSSEEKIRASLSPKVRQLFDKVLEDIHGE